MVESYFKQKLSPNFGSGIDCNIKIRNKYIVVQKILGKYCVACQEKSLKVTYA